MQIKRLEINDVSKLKNIKQGLICDIANTKKEFWRLPKDTPEQIKVTYRDYINYLQNLLEEISLKLHFANCEK